MVLKKKERFIIGTNFYRVSSDKIFNRKKEQLIKRLERLKNDKTALDGFHVIEFGDIEEQYRSPWEEFIEGTCVHLGKRSGGWKFCWNFHRGKFYKDKEELLKFIRFGKVYDEYGKEYDPEEFIEMALNWEQPDGAVFNEDYIKTHSTGIFGSPEYWDLDIDGLRVSSSVNFS